MKSHGLFHGEGQGRIFLGAFFGPYGHQFYQVPWTRDFISTWQEKCNQPLLSVNVNMTAAVNSSQVEDLEPEDLCVDRLG